MKYENATSGGPCIRRSTVTLRVAVFTPPGLTNTPSTADAHLLATGSLAGGGRCHGTMTFDGVVRKGSTCKVVTACNTARGFRHGRFSSRVELWG